MPSKVVDEIDKAVLGNLSLVDPAAEDAALVVAAKKRGWPRVLKSWPGDTSKGFSSLRGA